MFNLPRWSPNHWQLTFVEVIIYGFFNIIILHEWSCQCNLQLIMNYLLSFKFCIVVIIAIYALPGFGFEGSAFSSHPYLLSSSLDSQI